MIETPMSRLAAALRDWKADQLMRELAIYGVVVVKDGEIITYEQMIDVDNPATPCDVLPVPSTEGTHNS